MREPRNRPRHPDEFPYDNSTSGLAAETMQDAVDELATAATDPDRVWMPLTSIVGGVPELVWDADGSLIPTGVPIT